MVLAALLMVGSAWGQKGKIKGDPAPMNSDTNSVSGKAAMRGSNLMKASRDSLQASGTNPGTAVVDSFATAPKSDMAFTLTKREDFLMARQRITDAEQELDRAAKALAKASQSGAHSDAALEAAAARIKVQSDQLTAISKRLAEIEKAWMVGRAPLPVAKPTDSPKAAPAPVTPSPKGGLLGKPPVTPAAPANSKLK